MENPITQAQDQDAEVSITDDRLGEHYESLEESSRMITSNLGLEVNEVSMHLMFLLQSFAHLVPNPTLDQVNALSTAIGLPVEEFDTLLTESYNVLGL